MRITFALRLLTALIFALIAFIFSDVVGDVSPFSRSLLRIIITIWFGLVGFGIFPEVASRVSKTIINLTNLFISRVATDVMNQVMRVTRTQPFNYVTPTPENAALGGVSMNLPLLLDTSAIIDGRILDVSKTGFLFGTILVPSFVLIELQQVADSSDYLKRIRGRRGFEIIEELKKVKGIRIEIWDKDISGKGVDDKLVKLAKNLKGRIITTDYNLNRLAVLSGIVILNINDLANALKTIAIPGDKIKVKLVHLGKDAKQAVGYLDDGTMLVVEDGADMVGKDVKVEITRMLQSSAGRMIFAKKA